MGVTIGHWERFSMCLPPRGEWPDGGTVFLVHCCKNWKVLLTSVGRSVF